MKGGQALLVRWPSARYSTDIDLLSAEDTTDAAVDALKAAATLRLAGIRRADPSPPSH